MPATKNQFARLKAIHELIKAGPITRERLFQRLNRMGISLDHGHYSVSTLDKDIKYLKKMGAPIKTARGRGYYYVTRWSSNFPLSQTEQRAIEAFMELEKPEYRSLFAEVHEMFCELYRSINNEEFEEKFVMRETVYEMQGAKWMTVIYDAIRKQIALTITYTSHKSKIKKTHHFSPYFLKESKGIWYVIGYSDEKGFTIVLALDRINEIRSSNINFFNDPNFNQETYFKFSLGVYQHVFNHPEEIQIWVSNDVLEFFISRPIHRTQRTIRTENDGAIIQLNVLISAELSSTIMSWGDKVKVLAPDGLVNEMREKARSMAALY